MIIRDAKVVDIPALVIIAFENYRNNFMPLLPHCDWSGYDEEHFKTRFERSLTRMRVAVDPNPCGFSLSTAGHIDMLFVSGLKQGQSIGSLLLRDAETHGATSLEVFALNQRALRFYCRQGWEEVKYSARLFGGVSCEFVRLHKLQR